MTYAEQVAEFKQRMADPNSRFKKDSAPSGARPKIRGGDTHKERDRRKFLIERAVKEAIEDAEFRGNKTRFYPCVVCGKTVGKYLRTRQKSKKSKDGYTDLKCLKHYEQETARKELDDFTSKTQ